MRKLIYNVEKYADGTISYRYSYYNTPNGDRIYHGLFESYMRNGELDAKLFVKGDLEIGLGIEVAIYSHK